MAYGLDVLEIIHTDSKYVDKGCLSDGYTVDLDINGEKDYVLTVDDVHMEIGGIWYVDGTEFGGKLDKYVTDPKTYKVSYSGRSWRGIQSRKIIEVPESRNVNTYSGAITSIVNDLLKQYDLDELFICDVPYLETKDTFPTEVTNVDVVSGTSVYDAIVKMGDSIGFSFIYEFNSRDRKVHMIPIVSVDYTDMMTYNRDNSLSFKITKNSSFVNHLLCSGIDESGKRRNIHLFLNEVCELQPYSIIDKPIKDTDYILDNSKKVIDGINEIEDYYETTISVDTNYEQLTEQPSDWAELYGSYFTKDISSSVGEYKEGTVGSDGKLDIPFDVELIDGEINTTLRQKQQNKTYDLIYGTDWNLYNPTDIVQIIFDDAYKNWNVSINGITKLVPANAIVEFKKSELPDKITINSNAKTNLFVTNDDVLELDIDYWVFNIKRTRTVKCSSSYYSEKINYASYEKGSENYNPVQGEYATGYNLVNTKPADWDNTYSYYYTRSWDDSTAEYKYSNVSASTILDESTAKLVEKPSDWDYRYSEYYYRFWNGNRNEYRQFQGNSKESYELLKGMPEDWDKNYGSYYRKAYKVTYKKGKSNKTETLYSKSKADTLAKKHKVTALPIWVAATPPKGKKKPTFKKNTYYIRTSTTVAPKFKKGNTYLVQTKLELPVWTTGRYFEYFEGYKAPTFEGGKFYREWFDHYAQLVRDGSQKLLEQELEESQDVTLDDLDLNIGDMVGGEDEISGELIVQPVTNKIIKINNGVVYVDYTIGG